VGLPDRPLPREAGEPGPRLLARVSRRCGVYHLFSKRLYAQIDKETLRNRRKHSTEFIKTRLLLLDFIIAHPHHNYLETEQAKVAYFCEQLGLLKRSLPVKAYLELAIEKPPSDTSWTNTHCSSIPPMPLPPLWSPSLMWTPAMLGSLACQPLERLHSVVTIAASFSISLHREFRQPISREQRGAFPRSYGPLLEPTFQQSFCAIFDCAKGGR